MFEPKFRTGQNIEEEIKQMPIKEGNKNKTEQNQNFSKAYIKNRITLMVMFSFLLH